MDSEVTVMWIEGQTTHDRAGLPIESPTGASTADEPQPDRLWSQPATAGGAAVIRIRTEFSLVFQWLLVLASTQITVDGRSHTLPWGTSSFLVGAGSHRIRVSFSWLRRRAGAAETTAELGPGEAVSLRYRPPRSFAFCSGALIPEGRTSDHHQIDPLVFAPDPHTRGRWRAGVLAFGVVCTVVAAALGSWVGHQLADRGSGSDGWVTARAQGMSISLPRAFDVTTDPADYVEALELAGPDDADALAHAIERFPDLFALAGVDKELDPGASVVVLHEPSIGASLDEIADLTIEAMEESGFLEVTGESETSVGTGGYAAVRISSRGQWPESPRFRSELYLIDGGAEVWTVEFVAERDQYGAVSPTFERSIASLELPTGGA